MQSERFDGEKVAREDMVSVELKQAPPTIPTPLLWQDRGVWGRGQSSFTDSIAQFLKLTAETMILPTGVLTSELHNQVF